MRFIETFLIISLCHTLNGQCITSNPNTEFGAAYNASLSVEANFNAARRWEETMNGLSANCLGNLVPPFGGWASLSPAQEAFYIIQAERVARSLLPLTSVEGNLSSVAQTHANWLFANNHFSHTGSNTLGTGCAPTAYTCDASWTTAGSCFNQRINANLNVGTCWQSIGENIGIETGSTTDVAAQVVYGMIYRDLTCCAWGHRNNFLKIYDNNFGSSADEGMLGIAVAEGGGYQWPFSAACTQYYAKIIVFEVYDPQAGAICAFVLPIDLARFEVEEMDCSPRLS